MDPVFTYDYFYIYTYTYIYIYIYIYLFIYIFTLYTLIFFNCVYILIISIFILFYNLFILFIFLILRFEPLFTFESAYSVSGHIFDFCGLDPFLHSNPPIRPFSIYAVWTPFYIRIHLIGQFWFLRFGPLFTFESAY